MSPLLRIFIILLIITVVGKYYLYVLHLDTHESEPFAVGADWFESNFAGFPSGGSLFGDSSSQQIDSIGHPGDNELSGGYLGAKEGDEYPQRLSYGQMAQLQLDLDLEQMAGNKQHHQQQGNPAAPVFWGAANVASASRQAKQAPQRQQTAFIQPLQQQQQQHVVRDTTHAEEAHARDNDQQQQQQQKQWEVPGQGGAPAHHGQGSADERSGSSGATPAVVVKLKGEADYVWVFHNADGGYKYNHMATSEVLPGGRLVVAWQRARMAEGLNDQQLVWSISSDNGKTWTAPQVVPGRQSGIMWTPSLFRPPGGRLYLFYTESHGCWWCESPACFKQHCKAGASNCDVTVKFGEASINLAKLSREALRRRLLGTSSGGGSKRGAKPSGPSKPPTWRAGGDLKMVPADFVGGDLKWGEPKVILSEQAFGPVPKVIANPPIVDPKTGSWVLPYWRETPRGEVVCPTKAPGGDYAAVLISSNKGSSWRSHSSITMPSPWKNLTKPDWLIEGSVAPSADGQALLQVFRTAREVAYMARSEDGGSSWQPAKATPLRNPNAKMNILRLSNGALAAAFNNHGSEQYKRRSLMTVSVSPDDGKTWEDLIVLETRLQQELRFHYPMLRQMDCELLVTYSVMTPPKSQERGGIRLVTLPVCFGGSHPQCPC